MSRGFTENALLPVLSFTQHFGCNLNWVMERWQQLYKHKERVAGSQATRSYSMSKGVEGGASSSRGSKFHSGGLELEN